MRRLRSSHGGPNQLIKNAVGIIEIDPEEVKPHHQADALGAHS